MRILRGAVTGALCMLAAGAALGETSQIGRGDRYTGAEWASRSPVIAIVPPQAWAIMSKARLFS